MCCRDEIHPLRPDLLYGLSTASKLVLVTEVNGIDTLASEIKRRYGQYLNGK